MSSGYSGTPLTKKLGIKPSMKYALYGEPDFYFELFDEWPTDISHLSNPENEELDFIHIFCKGIEDLEKAYAHFKPLLSKNGMMWISWPKKSSGIETDIDGNKVRSHILLNGLVDVKIASIDKTWSALKAVYRKKDR